MTIVGQSEVLAAGKIDEQTDALVHRHMDD